MTYEQARVHAVPLKPGTSGAGTHTEETSQGENIMRIRKIIVSGAAVIVVAGGTLAGLALTSAAAPNPVCTTAAIAALDNGLVARLRPDVTAQTAANASTSIVVIEADSKILATAVTSAGNALSARAKACPDAKMTAGLQTELAAVQSAEQASLQVMLGGQ